MLGRSNRVVIGKHSGLSAIDMVLSELRLPADSEERRRILARVREYAVANKGPVREEVIARIWRETRSQWLPSRA